MDTAYYHSHHQEINIALIVVVVFLFIILLIICICWGTIGCNQSVDVDSSSTEDTSCDRQKEYLVNKLLVISLIYNYVTARQRKDAAGAKSAAEMIAHETGNTYHVNAIDAGVTLTTIECDSIGEMMDQLVQNPSETTWRACILAALSESDTITL